MIEVSQSQWTWWKRLGLGTFWGFLCGLASGFTAGAAVGSAIVPLIGTAYGLVIGTIAGGLVGIVSGLLVSLVALTAHTGAGRWNRTAELLSLIAAVAAVLGFFVSDVMIASVLVPVAIGVLLFALWSNAQVLKHTYDDEELDGASPWHAMPFKAALFFTVAASVIYGALLWTARI